MKKVQNILAALLGYRFGGCVPLINIAEGTHEDSITKISDAAITARYLLVKHGTDALHVALCGASDKPLGVCDDEAAAAEDSVNVNLLGVAKRTRLMTAAGEIALDADVFTAASGKVQALPGAAGTYYNVGRAISAAAVNNDVLEVVPREPLAVVVPA